MIYSIDETTKRRNDETTDVMNGVACSGMDRSGAFDDCISENHARRLLFRAGMHALSAFTFNRCVEL